MLKKNILYGSIKTTQLHKMSKLQGGNTGGDKSTTPVTGNSVVTTKNNKNTETNGKK